MNHTTFSKLVEIKCKEFNVKITRRRRIIARVLEDSLDHPDIDLVHKRALEIDSGVNLSTVYRNVKLFEQWGLLKKHHFRDHKVRYELETAIHHDHVIDIETNNVVEFTSSEVRSSILKALKIMGYDLLDYNLEIYAVRSTSSEEV